MNDFEMFFYVWGDKTEQHVYSCTSPVVPQIGSSVSFKHLLYDREKWQKDALERWDKLDEKEFRVVEVKHQFVFRDISSEKHRVNVILKQL
jgi:hypothetical protein